MTDTQIYITVCAPMLFIALLITVLIVYINARFQSVEQRLEEKFEAINQRFDDMRDLWRAELHRVEEVLDARLKHIEQSR